MSGTRVFVHLCMPEMLATLVNGIKICFGTAFSLSASDKCVLQQPECKYTPRPRAQPVPVP